MVTSWLQEQVQWFAYGGMNEERNSFGLEPIHVTVKLTAFTGLFPTTNNFRICPYRYRY
jgi:hypothetical protein